MDWLVVANLKVNLSLLQVEIWLVVFSAGYRPAAGIRVALAA